MRIITQFPHNITETSDMGITMPDGCRLSARVWMPDDAEQNPVPAILEYIPYRKRDGTVARDETMHKYFARRGYVVVRLDLRGSGDSQGIMTDEYTQIELDDAVHAIDWISNQNWCSGPVGMMGKSWGGFNCLQVAALAPAALNAIVTVCSTVDRFADDIHYKGGCLLNDNFAWGSQMLSYSSRPPDPMLVGEGWREMWLERLNAEPFLTATWLEHQERNQYWKHGSVCEDYSAIKAAVLSFGGWADNYMNTVAHLVENLDGPVKGIVGPWVHQYPHEATPSPQIGFLQEALRWWDHWLKGMPTGVENDPAYRVWMQESVRPSRMRTHRAGRWVAEKTWPSSRVKNKVWHLGEDGVLAHEPAMIDTMVNSPLDCGFGTGFYFPMSGDVPQMPGDQRDDDARSACFDSPPLVADLDLLGACEVKLELSSDQPHAQIILRLCEVHPDGASTRLSYGVLNLCHRNSHETPANLPINEPFTIKLRLDQFAVRIKAGMRLRVAISSSYWPFIWPVPHPVKLAIKAGKISLPVHHGSQADEWRFEPAEGAAPWQYDELRAPSYASRVTCDQSTGEITVLIDDDEGLRRDQQHGLQSGSRSHLKRSITGNDPLSASAESHWTQELSRQDWSIRTETHAKMWSSASTFHLSANIKAFEGDELIFNKDFKYNLARKFG